MPAVIRSQTKFSLVQKFRVWSEKILTEAAQEDLFRAYPGTGTRPRAGSPARRIVRFVFTRGFRVTPRPIRQRLMAWMLIRKGQRWNSA